MNDRQLTIRETDWGFHLIVKKDTSTNNSNLLDRIILITELCKEKEKNKILYETASTTRKITMTKIFRAAQLLEELKGWHIKIAVLAPHLHDHENTPFMETTAINRAINLKYFETKKKALEWLKVKE